MKILLIKDVYKLGHAGDIKRVADGYGRNFLLPQGLAVLATPGALKQAEKIREEADRQRAIINNEMTAIAEMLKDVVLAFAAKAGETGKMYGSITAQDVVNALKAKTDIEVKRHQVDMQPLRTLGEHKADIRLTMDLVPEIKIVVYREGEANPTEPPPVAEAPAPVIEEVAPVIAQEPTTEMDVPPPVDEAPAPVMEEPTPVAQEETMDVDAPPPADEAPAPVMEEPAPVAQEESMEVDAPPPADEAPAPVMEEPAPVAQEESRKNRPRLRRRKVWRWMLHPPQMKPQRLSWKNQLRLRRRKLWKWTPHPL